MVRTQFEDTFVWPCLQTMRKSTSPCWPLTTSWQTQVRAHKSFSMSPKLISLSAQLTLSFSGLVSHRSVQSWPSVTDCEDWGKEAILPCIPGSVLALVTLASRNTSGLELLSSTFSGLDRIALWSIRIF